MKFMMILNFLFAGAGFLIAIVGHDLQSFVLASLSLAVGLFYLSYFEVVNAEPTKKDL